MRPVAVVWALVVAGPLVADPDPEVELLVVSGEHVTLLTITVELDGRPQAEVWSGVVDAIFTDADVDGDSSLDEREAGRVLSSLRVRQFGWGYLWAVPRPAELNELDTSPRDGKVTRHELGAYYHRHAVDVPQVGVGHAPAPGTLTDAILERVDGKWDSAEVALRPLDRDGDELIRADELVARTPYPGSAGGVMLVPPADGMTLPKLLSELPLVRLPPRHTGGVRVPIPGKAIRADANADGELDGLELAAIRERPDVLSLTLRLGERTSDRSDAPLSPDEPDGIRFIAYVVPANLDAEFASARKAALERFVTADADRNGKLGADEAEIAGHAPLRDHFSFADRDADAQLSRTEWESYLTLRARIVATSVNLTILDHGRGLFEVIDRDGDGALSPRELKGARSLLEEVGCFRDGRFDAGKLPHTLRLVASHGRPESLTRIPPRSGPGWFLAMDRNHDGDVSRREFVGTDDAFRALDSDGDGFVSPREASPATERP